MPRFVGKNFKREKPVVKKTAIKKPATIRRQTAKPVKITPRTVVTKQNFFSFFNASVPRDIQISLFQTFCDRKSGKPKMIQSNMECVNRLCDAKKSNKLKSFGLIVKEMKADGFKGSSSLAAYINKKFKIYSEEDIANAQADRSSGQKTGGFRAPTPQYLINLVFEMLKKGMTSAQILRELNKTKQVISKTKLRSLVYRYRDEQLY